MDSGHGKIKVKVEEDLKDLIPGFLENRVSDAAAILEALKAGDFEKIRTIGHQMKGCGASYGFPPITEIGAAIETEAKDKRADKLPELSARLSDYVKRLEITYE